MEKLLFSAPSACPVGPADRTGVPQANQPEADKAGGEYKLTYLHSKAGTFNFAERLMD
ncbi:MAG: hypothetical protein U9N83_05835 [Thermodesulfobacteriota bacterium]|nr:hypothetical protein [Thermodesulfobacteriota bacterium]